MKANMNAFIIFLIKHIDTQIKHYYHLATSSVDQCDLAEAALIRNQVAELITHLDYLLFREISDDYLIQVSENLMIDLYAESFDALCSLRTMFSSSNCQQSVTIY